MQKALVLGGLHVGIIGAIFINSLVMHTAVRFLWAVKSFGVSTRLFLYFGGRRSSENSGDLS
jgi:hypothetical protein